MAGSNQKPPASSFKTTARSNRNHLERVIKKKPPPQNQGVNAPKPLLGSTNAFMFKTYQPPILSKSPAMTSAFPKFTSTTNILSQPDSNALSRNNGGVVTSNTEKMR